MIERVAAAMAESMNGGMFNSPQFYNGEQRELWLNCARVLLQTMREPTVEMVRAATKAAGESMALDYDNAWRAMIDAALEKP